MIRPPDPEGAAGGANEARRQNATGAIYGEGDRRRPAAARIALVPVHVRYDHAAPRAIDIDDDTPDAGAALVLARGAGSGLGAEVALAAFFD